jgi:putative colanic acid biosynthesis UDP-glucose lipid carrier transferase
LSSFDSVGSSLEPFDSANIRSRSSVPSVTSGEGRGLTSAQLEKTLSKLQKCDDATQRYSLSHEERLIAGASRLSSSGWKRALDVVGALFGLVLLAPVLLLVALLVKLETPGPAIFRQTRTGHNGRPFRILKFRTMRVEEDGATVTQASRGDARITPLGSFLRRSCIDELPQLINILAGDMSLVGPRPHAVAHDRYYEALISGYSCRFLAKPGLTGRAQTTGFRGATPDIEMMQRRIDYDLEYICGWSFKSDLSILLQTISAPFDPGAY